MKRNNQSKNRIPGNLLEPQAKRDFYFVDLGAHGAEEDAKDFMEASILIRRARAGAAKSSG